MDLKNMTAREVYDRVMEHSRSISSDEWLEIGAWIDDFLKGAPPPEEKKLFVPLGCAEMVTMICDGIVRWKKSICIQCRRQQGCAEYCCSVYEKSRMRTGGIPNKIWADENAECPYFEKRQD